MSYLFYLLLFGGLLSYQYEFILPLMGFVKDDLYVISQSDIDLIYGFKIFYVQLKSDTYNFISPNIILITNNENTLKLWKSKYKISSYYSKTLHKKYFHPKFRIIASFPDIIPAEVLK